MRSVPLENRRNAHPFPGQLTELRDVETPLIVPLITLTQAGVKWMSFESALEVRSYWENSVLVKLDVLLIDELIDQERLEVIP